MTKLRNQTFVKQVLARDLGLCRCCGFKAEEVHHIIPLIYGGEDKLNNMIALCWTCHIHAPNNKLDFYRYSRHGGARTEMLLGKIVNSAFEEEGKSNGLIKANEIISIGRKILYEFRKMEYNYALENYHNKLNESLVIEDVNFENEMKIVMKSEQLDKQVTKETN